MAVKGFTTDLPIATGADAGKVPTVQSDGSYELSTPSGGGSPGGANGSIQFNNSSVLDGFGNWNTQTFNIDTVLGASQIDLTTAGTGGLGFLNYGADDQEIHFGMFWDGSTYTAADTTVGGIFRSGNNLQFYIQDGNTIGNSANYGLPRLNIDGSTGNAIFDGAVSAGQPSPMAQLHVTPFPSPSNFNASISAVGTGTGYNFGQSSISYNLYSEDSTQPKFSPAIAATFTEPPSSNYDPSGAGANFTGGGGYIESGYDFQYTFYSLWGGQTQIGNSVTTNDTGNDGGDGVTVYAVAANITPPVGGAPDAYLVICSGSNPNSGMGQIVSGSFTDNGTGWDPSLTPSSYSALKYQVALGWTSAGGIIDNYIIANGNNTTYLSAGNVGGATDDNSSWSSGSPTVTPTGQTKTAIFDGSEIDINGVSYNWPSANLAGFLFNDGAGDFSFQSVGIGAIAATNGQIPYGSGSVLVQNSNLEFDGTNFILNHAGFGFTAVNDNTSAGTLNNYSVLGDTYFRFGSTVVVTGFSNAFSGKIIYVQFANGGTLKNQNTGSNTQSRINTPGAIDLVVPILGIVALIYNGGSDDWDVIDAGKPDLTALANTWALSQVIPGVTTNSNAAAGIIGEYASSTVPNKSSTVTFTIASPLIVNWTAHGLNNLSPVVFTTTGALPTGITAGTVYWTCNVTTNAFNIATSIANAIALTKVNGTGSQSGTQTATSGLPLSTGSPLSLTALSLTAGDYDVWGTVAYTAGSLTTATAFQGSIGQSNNSLGTIPNNGAYTQLGISVAAAGLEPVLPVGRTRISIAGTTTIYLVTQSTFATSTMTGYGFIGARRVR